MKAAASVPDSIDRKILGLLQESGRMSNVDLAKAVNLSPTPCLERVRRLERNGYIDRYVAHLSPDKLNAGLLSFIEVSLDRTNPNAFNKFQEAVSKVPEIQECHMVAGGFDYLLKVRVADMSDYRRFLGEQVSLLPGVDRTHTYVVMEEVKSTHAIALPEVE